MDMLVRMLCNMWWWKKNHVIVNVIAPMDIHQIFAKTMVNAMVNQERKRIATRTLNVHQNANSVQTGNHGCPAQKHVVVVLRADRKNASARIPINVRDAKVFHQQITLNVILNHALAGETGLHGQNVLMHVAKMFAPEKEKIFVNIFPLRRAKRWKLKFAQAIAATGDAGMNGQNVTVHVTKVLEPDHVNATVHQAHQ